MRRCVLSLVVAVLVTVTVGCGTMMNQSPPGTYFNSGSHRPNRLYGGVRRDGELLVNHIAQVARGEPTGSCSSISEHDPVTGEFVTRDTTPVSQKVMNATVITLFFVADFPLSFLADTIFLPVDFFAQWKRLTGRTYVNEQPKQEVSPQKEGVHPSTHTK